MTELRPLRAPRDLALVVLAALMLGGPANGQGPFPPVPGPFPVMSGMGFAAQMPGPQASAAERPVAPARPLFQPPANVMRLPYWMQAPQDATPQSAAAATVPAVTAAPARTVQTSPARAAAAPQGAGTIGYVQPGPPWNWSGNVIDGPVNAPGPAMVPGYVMVPGFGMSPAYGGVALPTTGGQPTGAATAAAPGTAWGGQPGWGYRPAPGWGPTPYAPVPGWGWAAPATGAGQ